NYIELTMGYPREWSRITVSPEGQVEVAVGTLSSGQGHETSFAQCISDWLGVPFEQVRLVQGDTDIIPVGGGSHSGRSMRMAGVCMGSAATSVVERSRRIAAHVFNVAPEAVEFSRGGFRTAGVGHMIGLFDIARAAQELNDLDDDLRGPVAAEGDR